MMPAASSTFRFRISGKRLPSCSKPASLPRAKASPRYPFRLGSRNRFSKRQEDQGIARECFHHGEQDRPHDRSAGSDSNRNSAVTLRDADGFVATGGVSTFASFSRWLAHRHRRGRAGLQRHHGLVADPLRTAREPPAPVGSIVVVHADCRDPRCICPRQRHAVRAAPDLEKIEWPAFTPSWPLCARSASSAA
jgi:hypothetical protein